MVDVLRKKVSSLSPSKPFFLSFVLFIITLVIGGFFLENIAFFNDPYTSFMTNKEYFLTLGVVIVSLLTYLIFSKRHFTIKIAWAPLLLLAAVFGFSLVAILTFPSYYETIGRDFNNVTYTIHYSLSTMERVRYLINSFVGMTYIYVILFVYPKTARNLNQTLLIHYLIVLVGIFSVVFSLVKEWNQYVNIFSLDPSKNVTVIMSFFNNPNTYGVFLLASIFSCCYIYLHKRGFFYLPLIFLLFFASLFSLSSTSVLLESIVIAFIVIYLFIKTFKCHPGLNVFGFILVLLFALFLILGTFAGIFAKVPGLGPFFGYIKRAFDSSSGTTLFTRIQTWSNVIALLDTPLKWIFGIGEYNFGFLLGHYEKHDSHELNWAHNGYVQELGIGGIARLIVYLILLGWLFYLCIRRFSRKERSAPIMLLFFLVSLVQSFAETTNYLSCESRTLLMLVILAAPPLTPETKDEKVVQPILSSRGLFKWVIALGLFVLIGLATNVTYIAFNKGQLSRYSIVALITFDVLFLFSTILLTKDFSRGEDLSGIYKFEAILASKLRKRNANIESKMSFYALPKFDRMMKGKPDYRQ